MKNALKFILPLLGNAALVFADSTGDCPTNCAPKQECKTVCKEKCEPCPTKKICKTTCVTVRPRPPCECVTRAYDCGVDFFVTADFTWWKAKEDGLEYAATEPLTPSTTPAQGRVYHPHTNYKPGFKVGLGLDFGSWGWDFFANYTWFRTSARHDTGSSVTSGSGLVVQDAYWFANFPEGGAATTIPYTSAASTWKLNMNVVDAGLGRKYWIGKHIMLRPHAGFKGVWNKQTLNNSYNGFAFIPGTNTTSNNHLKNSGIGVRGGMNAAWHFSRGFSLIGDMALTALWQRFRVTRYDATSTLTTPPESEVNIKDRYDTVTPVLEMMIGLNWETWWSGDNYHFAIRAGWEEQVWFDQNRFIRLPSSVKVGNSDLSLQGLTLGVLFEF